MLYFFTTNFKLFKIVRFLMFSAFEQAFFDQIFFLLNFILTYITWLCKSYKCLLKESI